MKRKIKINIIYLFQLLGYIFVLLSLILYDSNLIEIISYSYRNILYFGVPFLGILILIICLLPKIKLKFSRNNFGIFQVNLFWFFYIFFVYFISKRWGDGTLEIYNLGVQISIFLLINLSIFIKSINKSKLNWSFIFKISIFGILILIYLKYKNIIYLNKNWLALAIFFLLFFYNIIKRKEKLMQEIILWIIFVILNLFIIQSRGVLIASLIFLICLLIFNLLSMNRYMILVLFVLYLFLTIILTFYLANFFGSDFYNYINSQSVKLIGRSFDSSRLVRWNAALNVMRNNSLSKWIFGYGLDAALYYVVPNNIEAHGAMHNTWMDILIRVGFIGLFIKFSLISLFASKIILLKKYYYIRYMSFMFSLPVFMVVYSLFGFTHVPATLVIVFIISTPIYLTSEKNNNSLY